MRVATRGSVLARWQAGLVSDLLEERDVRCQLVVVDTTGDRRLDLPISALGGQGVFVKEVQAAVLDGRADLAVHSAKDLPSVTAPGLRLACVPVRADPRDALVGRALADLPAGARIATGSPRRRAQLAWARPDLTFAQLRGNVPTRVERAADHGAVVVALAALQRLGLAGRAAEILDPGMMLPQVGQGALAVECRDDDPATAALLAQLDDVPSRVAVDAERAFLAGVGGGCDLPVGAWARPAPGARLVLDAMLASPDGRVLLRERVEGPAGQAVALGAEAATRLLHQGGSWLLEDLGSGVRP